MLLSPSTLLPYEQKFIIIAPSSAYDSSSASNFNQSLSKTFAFNTSNPITIPVQYSQPLNTSSPLICSAEAMSSLCYAFYSGQLESNSISISLSGYFDLEIGNTLSTAGLSFQSANSTIFTNPFRVSLFFTEFQ
eukprot:Sdes_comp18472_c0_seq2m8456